MTQTEQWIACLALVYALPSFFFGIGLTLLWVRWRDHRRANGGRADKREDPLPTEFRLPQLFDPERLVGL